MVPATQLPMTAANQPGCPSFVATLSAHFVFVTLDSPGRLPKQTKRLFLSSTCRRQAWPSFSTLSYSVSFCLLALFCTFVLFVFNTFWPLLQKQGGGGGLNVAISNSRYQALVLAGIEELGRGGAPRRMLNFGSKLHQWHKDETAQVHARVGDL